MIEYEFDVETALGDTIGEKYEALYLVLKKINDKYKISTMIGSPDVMSIFACTSGFQSTTCPASMGGLKYLGKLFYLHSNINIQCFNSMDAQIDELILLSNLGNALIKIKGAW